MDQPDLDPALHVRALRGLARINRISGSGGNVWTPIQKLAAANEGRPLRVLDMATGGGDVPIWLWKKARLAGCELDIHAGEIVAYVVETSCNYFRPLAFPDTVHAGLRVAHIGNRSVRYELGLFRNDEPAIAAAGHFVHVYVDRRSGQSVALPEATRRVLQAICV